MAEFSTVLPEQRLKIVKRFRLAQDAPTAADAQATGGQTVPLLPNYHLDLDVEFYNLGGEELPVAYRLDGPTGLPIEGWWYASKIAREWWQSVGTRDVVAWFEGKAPLLIGCVDIANGEVDTDVLRDTPLHWMGVDAQYFSAVVIPQTDGGAPWFADATPIHVGPVPEDKAHKKLTNTSCRLVSKTVDLAPAEEGGPPSLSHTYRLFVGPKKPAVLEAYGLGDLVYHGWAIWATFSKLLLQVLHFFYSIVGNYGLAIIMLTVLVRSCMFPISRKQALGAQKMQELQPEIKKINEKFKNKLEERNRATQELFRKHKYNPLGGCLLMFLQLPIFIGLYRGLMLDVELRQAPLIPGLGWCSNLAAPDMLFRWDGFLPGFLAGEAGWLGPYFNVLPCITVGLFLWQQKMFMPPPADEQAALQQKIMQYMMIFMAVMFFKVASGLCIYFIASSLWGIAERKLLPKTIKPAAGAAPGAEEKKPGFLETVRESLAGNGTANGSGKGDKRKKQRGKK
jgi:YidC/Oxa1 family membrane protein insertase